MTPLFPTLLRVTADLERFERRCALVGGLAVSARVEARFTKDIDLAVAVADDSDAERLVRGLLGAGWSVHAAVEHERMGRLATVRLLHATDRAHGSVVDLLFASSGVEPEIVAEAHDAEPLEVAPGLSIPVARTGHLLAMKILSRVPQRENDHPDVVRLCRRADEAERSLARAAVRLIAERGYHRDRDIVALLEDALAEVPFVPK